MSSPIGRCTLDQLPESIRNSFLNGTIHKEKGKFISLEFDQITQWIMTIIIGPIMILVPSMMMFYLNYYLFSKPKAVLEFAQKVLNESWVIIIVTIILIAIIFVITFFMGKTGYTMIKELALVKKESKNQKKGMYHYGLLLTKSFLVARLEPEEGKEVCLFFPKEKIDKVERKMTYTGSSNRNMKLQTVIHYRTLMDDSWQYVLDEKHFSEKSLALYDRISFWAKSTDL